MYLEKLHKILRGDFWPDIAIVPRLTFYYSLAACGTLITISSTLKVLIWMWS